MLKPLVRVGNAAAQRHFFGKKVLGFGDMPNAQLRVFVDRLCIN
jgi:hypothetical protein